MRVTISTFWISCSSLLHLSNGAAVRRAQGTWDELTSTPILPRQENTAVGINSTSLAVLGGIVTNGTQVRSSALASIYHVPTNQWQQIADLPIPLNHPNAAVINGKIYLLGGLADIDGIWKGVPNAWVWDPETDTWNDLEPFPTDTERGSAAVAVVGDTVYLAGGQRSLALVPGGLHDTVDTVSAFDTLSGKWKLLPNLALPEPRDHAGAAVVGTKLFVTGGRHLREGLIVSGKVYSVDFAAEEPRWTLEDEQMPTARGGHMAAAIGDQVYTFGGEGSGKSDSGVFDEVEVLDTTTGIWSRREPMRLPRHGTYAVAIGGAIYIPGGGLQQGAGAATDGFDVFRP
ncbi:hypothetical protein MCOR27_006926 [Pyricularia oryzae]|uniref:Galactose oxidase n=1 Tax=Pyricularia grisea TaxID=148305 RepID=A0ABQ8NCD4_PYRGI|nr:hypothetical protein MCOR01_003112 [Pyricularia oryzae]KAI6294783.1 hypothetical protein MCOR33_008177 [Pyricularia grisea]KAH9432605.1 hypothetical protein MCOR02_007294 [Pyricularia oryzae]KAI6257086.1 hypothetical protein MCOR19_006469 [Pyricularia oryzae]KAI6268983.1 hypothetical protein MCOR26_008943 [Pyricularia oryzae]